jgi:hypothetical protein
MDFKKRSYISTALPQMEVYMKRFVLLCICLLILTFSVGCSKTPYPFLHSTDDLVRIELGWAEDALNYSVDKALTEAEMSAFLADLQEIGFNKVVWNPTYVHGNAIIPTYANGDYEVICHFWNDRVKNGDVYFGWHQCDEQAFNEFFTRYS